MALYQCLLYLWKFQIIMITSDQIKDLNSRLDILRQYL
jgi:hypothetical protein